MKVDVVENDDEKLKIQIHTGLTLVNFLNDKIWDQKVDVSAYKQEHPYLSKPEVLVRAKNPKKAVLDACEDMIGDIKEFRKQFLAAVK